MSGETIGVIHEQGFYGNGLGFDPLSPENQQTLNENLKNQSGNDDSTNNAGEK